MKRINFNIKDRKLLYGIFGIVLVCVFSLTLAYAALSAVLTISGNAEVSASSWNVYLDNIVLNNASATKDKPTIVDKTKVNFSTILNMPGDYYEFTVDVLNNGSIDAMIENVTKTALTVEQSKFFDFNIEYQDGSSIDNRQLVEAGSFVKLKVRLAYRTDLTSSDLPSSVQNFNLSFVINYTQTDNNGIVVPDNGVSTVRVVHGDLNTPGSEICIQDECFYLMYNLGDSVTLFAKYNLYVGGVFDGSKYTAYGSEATGKQSSTTLGYVDGQNVRNGVTPFSSDSKTGKRYSDYTGSIVEGYVNNYKNYLNTLGVSVTSARLITNSDLESFGCSLDAYNCTAAPEWVHSTSYWTGSAFDSTNVWYVFGGAGEIFSYFYYYYDNNFGVRPVVVISSGYF